MLCHPDVLKNWPIIGDLSEFIIAKDSVDIMRDVKSDLHETQFVVNEKCWTVKTNANTISIWQNCKVLKESWSYNKMTLTETDVVTKVNANVDVIVRTRNEALTAHDPQAYWTAVDEQCEKYRFLTSNIYCGYSNEYEKAVPLSSCDTSLVLELMKYSMTRSFVDFSKSVDKYQLFQHKTKNTILLLHESGGCIYTSDGRKEGAKRSSLGQ